MRKLKDKSSKGKRLEKFFSLKLKELFPSSETEIKPRIINLRKDFWGLFDGLTFIKSKRKYIFWQIKGKKLSSNEIKHFWKQSKIFQTADILILLIEKTHSGWKIFYNNKKYVTKIEEIKNILNLQ